MLESCMLSAEKLSENVVHRINSKTTTISDHNKIIQLYFTDANMAYRIKITNRRVDAVEKSPTKGEAGVTVSCKVEILQGILDNKIGATRALITRKVIVDGPVLAIRDLRLKVLGPEHNATG